MPIVPINMARGAAPKESHSLRIGAIVEYENAGKTLLGIITGSRKNKWSVMNDRGAEVELSADRLYLFRSADASAPSDSVGQQRHLANLLARAIQLRNEVDLDALWEICRETKREVDSKDLTELTFHEPTLAHYIAVRHELIDNKIYFKRTKLGFEPRESRVVEELKAQQRVEEEKEAKRREKVSALLHAINSQQKDDAVPRRLSFDVSEIEQLAAQGMAYPGAKDALKLVDEALEQAKVGISGKPEEKAFRLLVHANHFSEHENLAMYRFRRPRDFSKELVTEAEQLLSTISYNDREDLRHLDVISIDALSTKDIDDALSFERLPEGYRIGVHITDVCALIKPNTKLFAEALSRATSIYCPDFRVAMLPPQLSENALSLIQGEDRLCMSFLILFTADGSITKRSIVNSTIRVKERLSYEEVDDILFDDRLSNNRSVTDNRHEMLECLWNASISLEERRNRLGAYQIQRREMVPVVEASGRVILEQYSEDSPSRKLVGELMILANETAALYAVQNSIPLVFRSQEAPDMPIDAVALDIPEGPARDFARRGAMKRSLTGVTPARHSGLGLDAYTQLTSPIRRVIDLLNQAQISAHLRREQLLESEELSSLLAQAAQSLDEVNSIQRESTRYWMLCYLKQEGIKQLAGIIVKVDGPKPLVEIPEISMIAPFHALQGANTITSGSARARLGKEIRLKIDSLDPRKDVLVLSEMP